MKKGALLLVLVTLLVSSLLVGIVSAATSGGFDNAGEKVRTVINTIVQIIDPVTSVILGESFQAGPKGGASPYFFVKILFFIIVLSIVWIALSRIAIFSEYPWALWLVSISIAILGMKFIVSPEWLSTILLPYGTLAIAISAGAPFVAYFIIVEWAITSRTLRRIAWLFFGVIFVFLWLTRDDLGTSSWIYPITALACLVMIMFDGTIQRIKTRIKIDKAQSRSNLRLMDAYNIELIDLDKQLKGKKISFADYNKRVKEVRKEMTKLSKL